MENKYYTPDIKEFSVGFEYQFRDYNPDIQCSWISAIIKDGTQIDDIHRHRLRSNDNVYELRVKCLDKEDIESLGFNNYTPPMEYDHTWHYLGSREPVLKAWFNNKYPVVRIYSSFPAIIFHGSIKNKSELKRILKMLEI